MLDNYYIMDVSDRLSGAIKQVKLAVDEADRSGSNALNDIEKAEEHLLAAQKEIQRDEQ